MKQERYYLPFPLFLFTFAVVGLGFWYTAKIYTSLPQPLDINEIVATGTSSLEASPAPANIVIGQELTLDINVHSGTDKVTSVKLAMSYDDTKLAIESLLGTDYLPVATVAAEISGNQVTATYSVIEGAEGKADWGTVAKLKLKALALGTQTITFTNDSNILTAGLPTGALKTVTPIVIHVGNVGDLNFDKKVDLLDYNIFVGDFDKSGSYSSDLDHSGQVNLQDYTLFTKNYGLTSP